MQLDDPQLHVFTCLHSNRYQHIYDNYLWMESLLVIYILCYLLYSF